jgi:hypothetical protein
MEQHQVYSLDQTLGALAETRARLAAIEAGWKQERAMSKMLTLSLVLDHGYSVFKASQVSGHNRQTVVTWINASKPSYEQ